MGNIIQALHLCIIEAGKAILDVYNSDFTVDIKQDETPITEADRRSHTIINNFLDELDLPGFSRLPLLSEEGVHTSYETRATWKRYWLVDPLDGTKEFVNRNGEFTVNIALIEDDLPLIGVVYVPVTDVLYWGVSGKGAYRLEHASVTGKAVSLPEKRLRNKTLQVVASRSHLNEETKEYIESVRLRLGKEMELVQAGSSLKFCRIAEGSADLYPRFGPTMEWDTAAAHGVCRAAGCSVINMSTGQELRYNKKDLHNPHFITAPEDKIDDYLIS